MAVRARVVAAGIAAFSVVGGFGAPAPAGPLNPPPGPIAPTAKPLAEVEPRIAISATNTPGDADSTFRISAPGSYYLTGNVSQASTTKAIEVLIGGGQQVTIDLNGFTIGASDAGRVLPAISVDGADAHVVIRNGSIRNWANAVLHTVGGSCELEGVKAFGSRLNQFELRDAAVTRCFAEDGGAAGFFIATTGVLTGCIARGNAGDGFKSGIGCVSVRDCAAMSNTGDGFDLAQGTADGCRADGNGQNGFVNPGAIVNCTSLNNTGDGITCGLASTVRGCTAIANDGDGIHVTSVARVEGNTVTSNGKHGVDVTGSRTVVVGNLIGTNGRSTGVFAGIFCSSSDCTIDSNQITSMTLGGDDFAIQVTGSSNLVIRNMMSNVSTTMSIAAGNTSGGTSTNPITASPWSNLTY
jgi:hypothetical protein